MSRKSYQRGSVSPAVVGLLLMVLCLGGLAVRVVSAPEGTAHAARAGSTQVNAATAFYHDVERSMSPLLNVAPLLSGLIQEVSSGVKPAPSVSQGAHDWAEDFATARDLVGRLHPLSEAQDRGTRSLYNARSLYSLGAALYAESARAVPRLVAVADTPEARQEALKAVSRLQVLGDRAFDAGNRLVRGLEATDVSVKRINVGPEVPDFTALGLQAGGAPARPAVAADVRKQQEPVAPSRWASRHADAISSAVAVLENSAPWLSSPGNAPDQAVRSAADSLEELTGRLGGSPPSSTAAAEGVHNLRLALLAAAESLRTVATDWQQAQRLRLIAERFWGLATDLLVSGDAGARSRYRLPPSGLDPELLRSGGVFNGRPPPLRPGEDPAKDVPNGLPPVKPGTPTERNGES